MNGAPRRISAVTVFGFAVVAALVLLRFAALFVDTDPALVTDTPMLGPSGAHLLGTDPLGRDLLARMIASSEAFFFPGLFACALAVLLAVPAGAAIGYWPEARASAAIASPASWTSVASAASRSRSPKAFISGFFRMSRSSTSQPTRPSSRSG